MRCNLSKMTAVQKKATEDYCKKWIKDEAMPLVTQNVEAIILWQLHEIFGFGKKRLMNFLDQTAPMIRGMLDEYCWDKDEDAIWLCKYKLRTELGIDLDKICSPFRETEVEMK